MLQLTHRLGLDLADALAGHLENAPDLLESVRVAVAQTVSQLDNFAFAIRERLEHLLDFVFEHLLGGGAHRRFGPVVLDEVAEITVLAFTHGPIEADGMAADLEDAAGLLDADAGRLGRLFDRRLATHLLKQFLGNVAELTHRLDHVDGDADGASLIGDGPSDRLANPPGRIGT